MNHNHPTGSVEPSPEDVALTRSLASAGVLVNIDVLDHIIVGDQGRYYSFKQMGQL